MSGNKPPPDGGGGKKRRYKPLDFPILGQKVVNDGLYYIAERLDGDKALQNCNRFLLDKFFKGIFVSGYSIVNDRCRDGHFMLVNSNPRENLNSPKEYSIEPPGIKIKISPCDRMNHSKGTIYAREYENYPIEELREHLKQSDQNIIDVERLKLMRKKKNANDSEGKKKEGAKKVVNAEEAQKEKEDGKEKELVLSDSPLLLITFNSPHPPEEIRVAFNNYEVRIFYDRPLRCTKCQQYRHTKKNCENQEVCPKCSLKVPHESECDKTLCVNCEGPHPANHVSCPVRRQEEIIKRMQIDNRISPTEARRKFMKLNKTAPSTRPFAEAMINSEETKRSQGSGNQEKITVDMYKTLIDQFSEIQKANQEMANQMRQMSQEMKALREENIELKRQLNASSSGTPAPNPTVAPSIPEAISNTASQTLKEDQNSLHQFDNSKDNLNMEIDEESSNNSTSRYTRKATLQSAGDKSQDLVTITSKNKNILNSENLKLFDIQAKLLGKNFACPYDPKKQILYFNEYISDNKRQKTSNVDVISDT